MSAGSGEGRVAADRVERFADKVTPPVEPDEFGMVGVVLSNGDVVTVGDAIQGDGKLWLQLPADWVLFSLEPDEYGQIQDGTPKGGTRIAFMKLGG